MHHAIQHYVYVHPLYCMTTASQNAKGFTVGITTDTDMYNLPDILIHLLSAWSALIYHILANDNMFPAGSAGDTAVKQGYCCGYALLNWIVRKFLLANSEMPAMLLVDRPRQ